MKKILLATTVLAFSAGFAAAEVKFSGTAAMGVASDAGGPFHSYSSANLAVEFVGESDSGLSFGATFSADMGHAYAFADDDGFSDGDGTFGAPEVWISGSFGKLAMNHNGYGFFHNDDSDYDQGDVMYTGTFGAFSVGLIADVEAYDDFGDDADMSVNLAYAANNLAANLNLDDNGDYDVSLGYTMGAITATVANDHDNVSSLELAYDANGITGSVKFDTDSFWSASAGYSANSMTVNVSTDADSAWSIDGEYDLGGGLALVAGVNYTDDAFLGATMSF